MALSRILDRVFTDIYVLVIGKMFAPAQVGFFQRAWSLQQLPSSNLQGVINSVSFPLLSRVKDDRRQLRRGLRLATQMGALISFPLFAFIATAAGPIILTMLGEKWRPCINILRLLCIPGAFYTLHATNLNLLMAVGRSDLFLRLEVLKKILVAMNVMIAARFGVEALIIGMSCISVFGLLLNTYYSGKLAAYGVIAQFRDILPMAIVGLIVGVTVTMVAWVVGHCALWLQLLLLVTVAMLVELAAIRLLPGDIKREMNLLAEVFPKITQKIITFIVG